MSYNVPSCVADLGNTGLSNCLDELEHDAMLVWTLESFSFTSEVSAETEADWLTAINAHNAYPMPTFEEIEPTEEDDVEHETSIGLSLFVREGKYGGVGRVRTALCNLANLRTFNSVQGRAFIVTGNGKVYGTSSDGVEFKGFELSKFRVSKLKGTDGSVPRMVEFKYQFKTPSEMGDYAAVPQLTWNPLTQLVGIVDVTVAVDSSAEGLVVLSVTRDCDGEGVEGLVEGDFTILASDGETDQLPSDDFTNNGDGTYDFVFDDPALGADDYTANLKTPADQTSGGYESEDTDSFTISE